MSCGVFASVVVTASSAQFAGGGIPPCVLDDEYCFGGEFVVDWIGYADGSQMDMSARVFVPEPATLLLVATGVGLAGLRRRRQK